MKTTAVFLLTCFLVVESESKAQSKFHSYHWHKYMDSVWNSVPLRECVPPALQRRLHEKDCDPNGWKYDLWEWMRMAPPRYYKSPIHGSNGGWALA